MMNKLNKSKNIQGFSLVELSISLAIIGLIASSALSVAVTSDYYIKKFETKAKMERLNEAMAGFLETNYRLPCPADGTLPTSDANFGLEGTPTATDCPLENFTYSSAPIIVEQGVIPIRTLQLPDDFMFDGWDRRFTYAVDIRYANNSTTNGSCSWTDGDTVDVCFIDAPGSLAAITIEDESGGNRVTNAIYVILSHGENGHGAYTKNGSSTRINGFPVGNPYRTNSADELENAEFTVAGVDTALDNVFVLKEYKKGDDLTSGATRELFDDIVSFKTKDQIVKDAGASLYDVDCGIAADIIINPGSNNCTGAADESNCESFADDVAARCME